MNNDAIGCNPALIPYLDKDREIIAGAMAEIKSMRGPSRRLAFTAAIRGLCNFVSQVPQAFVGRALICGMSGQNHIMRICRASLRRFLGTS
jgi:hypothetical protein